ncbi:MAG TPA: dipeptidase [Terriglobales bacterium]|nr:dipeptidase [Terriglobales bacterium]
MISPDARAVHLSSLVIDTHVDTVQRLIAEPTDLGIHDSNGAVDIPSLKAGGLSAIFFAVWVPSTVKGAAVVHRAMGQIDAIQEQVRLHPDFLLPGLKASDVYVAHSRGKCAVFVGLEGGHLIASDLGVLRSFAALGARYLTLTHGSNTDWADSSTDAPLHNGLTTFGKEVIRELNRLGMLVDVSHASDKTFYDALEISDTPVIASHSSCRSLCDVPRNLSDEMIKALAARGGVVQINFHTGFLDEKVAKSENTPELFRKMSDVEKVFPNDVRRQAKACREIARHHGATLPQISWTRIVDHIDHVVEVAGADHVGLGSDFDGGCMPRGMESVSQLPRITESLMQKGYSTGDIGKILGGNILRVLTAAEKRAEAGNVHAD